MEVESLFNKNSSKNNMTLNKIVYFLVIVGALNWGLVGLGYFFNTDWNVIDLIFGRWAALENAIYVLVGLSALKMLWKK